jgi:hypothetical protein
MTPAQAGLWIVRRLDRVRYLAQLFPVIPMAKPKKKLTAAQRAARKKRKAEFMTVFMNGRQVRVRRPPTVDGIPVEEFIRQNADPIWLHQHGHWEILHEREMAEQEGRSEPHAPGIRKARITDESDEIPF